MQPTCFSIDSRVFRFRCRVCDDAVHMRVSYFANWKQILSRFKEECSRCVKMDALSTDLYKHALVTNYEWFQEMWNHSALLLYVNF